MSKITTAAIALLFICQAVFGQEPDKIYMPNVKGVKFFFAGNQTGYPIINLGSTANTEIDFDDLDNYVKTYNYTYLLCNSDWQPADIGQFDYLTGFTQGRFSLYRNSAIARTKYIHYQAVLPESNMVPTKSGNYLLMVYLDGDTSKLAFTKRLLVVNNMVPVYAQVQRPFNQDLISTHQKVQFSIDKTRLNVLNPQQQIKIVILQNYRWDNALSGMIPQFMRGNQFEYNGEQDCLFPAGKEYRWANLESYRLLSERVDSASEADKMTDVYLKRDIDRSSLRVQIYTDYDGFFQTLSTDVNNAWWQGDYAKVHFTFVPQNNQPYDGKDVYIAGELTGYRADDDARMVFNADKGVYEKTLVLKQGYYSYTYLTKDANSTDGKMDAALTDGNYWETENTYTILVYYHSFNDRADELVAAKTVSSLNPLK